MMSNFPGNLPPTYFGNRATQMIPSQPSSRTNAATSLPNPGRTISIHDADFKNIITLPLSAVHHLPPAQLHISRLVLCRMYDPRDPHGSCEKRSFCKFVHVDMSNAQLQVQSIHVNYAYRSLQQVSIERLPAGEMLAIIAPNEQTPSQLVPSEHVLVTRGALRRNQRRGPPLRHCAHYFYNRVCNRGDHCSFLHCVYIDETATDYQRAPHRAGASHGFPIITSRSSCSRQQQQPPGGSAHPNTPSITAVPVPVEPLVSTPLSASSLNSTVGGAIKLKTCRNTCFCTNCTCDDCGSMSSCGLSEGGPRSCCGEEEEGSEDEELSDDQIAADESRPTIVQPAPRYRRNPYSVSKTTVVVPIDSSS